MRFRSLFVLSIALLSACATGSGDDEDGRIVRADAGSDDDGTEPEDTSPSTTDDTGAPIEDTGSGGEDTGTEPTDTGTPPTDTGPTSCTGEEPEPNNTASTARVLAPIDDCDPSGGTVTGVLSSSSDVDVLTFDGSDVFGCSVNPTVSVTGPARVCIKATCKSGTTEVKGCPKGTKTGSECCGVTTEIEINCTGTTSDDAKITITVRAESSAPMCSAYSLSYHY